VMAGVARLACCGCGAIFEDRQGPTHRYMESSSGCRAVYGEVLARDYGDISCASLHRLTVDACGAAPGTTVAPEHPVPGLAPDESLPGSRSGCRARSRDGFPPGHGPEQGPLHLALAAGIARLRHRQGRPPRGECDGARKARPRLGRVRVVRPVFSSRDDSRLTGFLGAAWRVRPVARVFPGGGSHATTRISGPP
jgi:Family of unknown function (DUF5946)